jgi:hypothetical protein
MIWLYSTTVMTPPSPKNTTAGRSSSPSPARLHVRRFPRRLTRRDARSATALACIFTGKTNSQRGLAVLAQLEHDSEPGDGERCVCGSVPPEGCGLRPHGKAKAASI